MQSTWCRVWRFCHVNKCQRGQLTLETKRFFDEKRKTVFTRRFKTISVKVPSPSPYPALHRFIYDECSCYLPIVNHSTAIMHNNTTTKLCHAVRSTARSRIFADFHSGRSSDSTSRNLHSSYVCRTAWSRMYPACSQALCYGADNRIHIDSRMRFGQVTLNRKRPDEGWGG